MVPWTLLWWLWLCLNMVAIKEELFTPGIKLWCWSPNYAKPPKPTSHGLSFLMIHDIASIWSSFSHSTFFICSRFFLLPCWVFFVQRFQSQKTVSICQHVRHIQIKEVIIKRFDTFQIDWKGSTLHWRLDHTLASHAARNQMQKDVRLL